MARAVRHILSFGCGVNTVALMIHLVRRGMPLDEAVFADTGGELPETYDYLETARGYLASHGVGLTVVRSKTGTLYETCVRRKVLPSQVWRWSTRDYKITPIHAYYRSLSAHVYEYMGIAYDEVSRMKTSREPYISTLFPLIDARMTRADCVRLIESAGLPVPVKSGCYFCPFNNRDRWTEIYRTHPDLYRKAMRLEENSKHFPEQLLQVHTLRGLAKEIRRAGKSSSQPAQLEEGPCSGYCMT